MDGTDLGYEAPRDAPLAQLENLARMNGWPLRIGPGGVAIELPSGALIAVFHSSLGGWHVAAHLSHPTLAASDPIDLASALAGLLASNATWPLHKAVDRADGPMTENDPS
jgi:hypothetical protein